MVALLIELPSWRLELNPAHDEDKLSKESIVPVERPAKKARTEAVQLVTLESEEEDDGSDSESESAEEEEYGEETRGDVPEEYRRPSNAPAPQPGERWAVRWGKRDAEHGHLGEVVIPNENGSVNGSTRTCKVVYVVVVPGAPMGTVVNAMPWQFMYKLVELVV